MMRRLETPTCAGMGWDGCQYNECKPHVGAGCSARVLSVVRVAAQVVAAHPDVDAAEHGKIMGQVRAVALSRMRSATHSLCMRRTIVCPLVTCRRLMRFVRLQRWRELSDAQKGAIEARAKELKDEYESVLHSSHTMPSSQPASMIDSWETVNGMSNPGCSILCHTATPGFRSCAHCASLVRARQEEWEKYEEQERKRAERVSAAVLWDLPRSHCAPYAMDATAAAAQAANAANPKPQTAEKAPPAQRKRTSPAAKAFVSTPTATARAVDAELPDTRKVRRRLPLLYSERSSHCRKHFKCSARLTAGAVEQSR